MNILLVEDNLPEARLIQEILKDTVFNRSEVVHVKRLWDAIAHLNRDSFDLVLLDLTLPDNDGLSSIDVILAQDPDLPIVVLTNLNDEDLAFEAIRKGAQDYLIKRHIDGECLGRSLRYAIQRKQAAAALREANEVLEQRVLERTYELESTNRQLQQEIEHRILIQERLELAQKVGKIGTFEWDIQTNEVTWSAALEALYGQSQGSFSREYKRWLETLHPDDRLKTEQELWQSVQCGQGLNTEFRALLPNGEIHWIAVKSSLFHDGEGNPRRMLGIHIDITEKKQFENQFLRAQRLESLGTLASGIAHDLNNVLTPILAVVQLLPMKLPDLNPQAQELLKILDTSVHRGSELVRQILSFTRGVEGKRIHLQLHHVLLESQTIAVQTFPKFITIDTQVPSDLWSIFGDVTQLHQVFMNLLVNARDAMPTPGTLSIRASNQVLSEVQASHYPNAKAGSYVVVQVQDTGVGISPRHIHHIFDPFFTTKEMSKGTGLGLSAVLGIVQGHGGFVDVQSEVGKGSTFTVYFPATEAPPDRDENDLEYLMGDQALVLVVDDEAAICDVVKTMLESYNYRVLIAEDGTQAIALMAEYTTQIQSVVVDMMMPRMEGHTVLPVLRQFNPQLYAIAMSGISSIEAVAQAEQHGFQAFLSKPFDTSELLQLLHQD